MPSTLNPSALSPPAPTWSWRLAFLLALFPLFSGLAFLALPSSASLYGLPHPTSPTHTAYLSLCGVRDLYVGGSVLLMWLRGDRRAVGWLLLLGGAVPVADGVVAWWNAAAMWQVLQHWAATAVCGVVGYSLLA